MDCKDTKVLYPLGAVNVASFKQAVNGLRPGGYTSIAYALEKAGAGLTQALQGVMQQSLKPVSGRVTIYRTGDRKEVVAQGSLNEKPTFPAGTYDVLLRVRGKNITWPSVRIDADLTGPGRRVKVIIEVLLRDPPQGGSLRRVFVSRFFAPGSCPSWSG